MIFEEWTENTSHSLSELFCFLGIKNDEKIDVSHKFNSLQSYHDSATKNICRSLFSRNRRYINTVLKDEVTEDVLE